MAYSSKWLFTIGLITYIFVVQQKIMKSLLVEIIEKQKS